MHPCIRSEMLIEHLLSSKPCDWNWGLSSDPSKCALCPLRAYGLVEEAGISPVTHQLINTWKLRYVPENKVVQCSESSLGGEGADLNMGSGQLLEKVTMDLRSKWWAGLKRESGEGKAFQTEGTACAKTLWVARTWSSLGSLQYTGVQNWHPCSLSKKWPGKYLPREISTFVAQMAGTMAFPKVVRNLGSMRKVRVEVRQMRAKSVFS